MMKWLFPDWTEKVKSHWNLEGRKSVLFCYPVKEIVCILSSTLFKVGFKRYELLKYTKNQHQYLFAAYSDDMAEFYNSKQAKLVLGSYVWKSFKEIYPCHNGLFSEKHHQTRAAHSERVLHVTRTINTLASSGFCYVREEILKCCCFIKIASQPQAKIYLWHAWRTKMQQLYHTLDREQSAGRSSRTKQGEAALSYEAAH